MVRVVSKILMLTHFTPKKPYEVIKKVPYEVKTPVEKPYPVKVFVPEPYEVIKKVSDDERNR